jgi:hypothetical protein
MGATIVRLADTGTRLAHAALARLLAKADQASDQADAR